MSNNVHVHDILNLMEASQATYSNESLTAALNQVFGEQAQYRSCKVQGMNVVEAIEFLKNKGKFEGTETAFKKAAGHSCSHH
ncbi:YecH family metal-binding protein [Motilimonas cestriensis]|uniref:YecH family metal-binding protein n=1 Tax=Motilimonas cestriensis TaxID=2742685 RepID=UPI003DA2F770